MLHLIITNKLGELRTWRDKSINLLKDHRQRRHNRSNNKEQSAWKVLTAKAYVVEPRFSLLFFFITLFLSVFLCVFFWLLQKCKFHNFFRFVIVENRIFEELVHHPASWSKLKLLKWINFSSYLFLWCPRTMMFDRVQR